MASAFHDRGWLQALARTYGYEPFVLTNTPTGKPLSCGVVLCRISSWLTGTRAVSLPFADHCEPLVNDVDEVRELANWLQGECDLQQWKYVELRPLSWHDDSDVVLSRSDSFCFHVLDLTPTLERIFGRLHKDSIQRRIRRAEKQHLSSEIGRSDQLVDEFYTLLMKTRRRHQLIPQPRSWFTNLVECMGDKIQIRVARKNYTPIAAMLTLRHRSSVVYKYGCSDERFHNLGGMPFLFWRLIEESKSTGATEIDFGRSDWDNPGLITFKDRFGTTRKSLTYFRYPQMTNSRDVAMRHSGTIRKCLSMLPTALLQAAGKVSYRHLG
jgi:hypothetical protein